MGTDEVPALIGDLLRPQALGLAAGQPTELRNTHASWVILTATDVWKIKRPVDFGFLDYHTLARRRHFCDEEVRLNRRLAPEIYLGVVPIHANATGHALTGEGPVVEWAVHMRRLPDQRSAQALADRDALDAVLLERVANHLAAFLGQAACVPAAGALAALRENVEENINQTAPFVGELVDPAILAEVRAFQLGRLSERADSFAQRVTADRIRDGHGDLRLEHIYFSERPDDPGSPPVIIDCIEFNARFRCGDVAAEIAFLAMELQVRGRADLAAGFVARFAEASDDFELYGVLDFYLCYRACVRAKVAALISTDGSGSVELRRRKREEARRDLALARSFAGVPLDRPFLIVVGGMIGSGKSTLASALGRALAVPVISSDRTRKAAAGLPPVARADAALYAPAERERTYATLMRRAAEVLRSGRGVILDATFSRARWRAQAAATARDARATFALIETATASAGVLRQRLSARGKGPSVSDATEAQLEGFLSEYQPPGEESGPTRFRVETDGPPEAALAKALRLLGSAGIAVDARQAEP